ncbi:hypothetical protein EfmU0317_2317 [Enterococcus faecium U0317]|nr:hypothetical protein EfmU0317_2317 [Enterococcus faecium U0317]
MEAVFPKAWRQRLPKPTNWVRLSVTFTSLIPMHMSAAAVIAATKNST